MTESNSAARRPIIAQIVACARRGIIGRDGAMPWHIPEDLQHFKRVTMGAPVIMGRKTFESIGRPLPGRTNIVLTHGAPAAPEGVVTAHSLKEALAAAGEVLKGRPETAGDSRIFIIGGAQVYRESRELADEIWLTEIDLDCEGDADFDAPDPARFSREVLETLPKTDLRPAVCFCLYRRK